MHPKRKLPKPTPAAVTEYNRLFALHRQAAEAVRKARAEGTCDPNAMAELFKLSQEFNALNKQFDFTPRGPLQDYIDKLLDPDPDDGEVA